MNNESTRKLSFQGSALERHPPFSQAGATAVPRPHGQKSLGHGKFECIRWSKETINTSPQSIELSREEDEAGCILLS